MPKISSMSFSSFTLCSSRMALARSKSGEFLLLLLMLKDQKGRGGAGRGPIAWIPFLWFNLGKIGRSLKWGLGWFIKMEQMLNLIKDYLGLRVLG